MEKQTVRIYTENYESHEIYSPMKRSEDFKTAKLISVMAIGQGGINAVVQNEGGFLSRHPLHLVQIVP